MSGASGSYPTPSPRRSATAATIAPRLATSCGWPTRSPRAEGYTTGPIAAADVEAMILVGMSMLGGDTSVVDRLVNHVGTRLPAAGPVAVVEAAAVARALGGRSRIMYYRPDRRRRRRGDDPRPACRCSAATPLSSAAWSTTSARACPTARAGSVRSRASQRRPAPARGARAVTAREVG